MTEIRAVFKIPKNRYKNSNTMSNRFVDESKSKWLRSYASHVWESALKDQFDLEALEPDESSWALPYKSSEKEAEKQRVYEEQESLVQSKTDALAALLGLESRMKEAKKLARKEGDKQQLTMVAEWEADVKNAKQDLKIARKLLTRAKNDYDKSHHRNDARHAMLERRKYLSLKRELNKDRRIFKGKVIMLIRSNIVTEHDFDAPNSWPSVKPIQDGGTDTCMLWEDDNNNVVSRTEFYGGCKASKKYYVLEMIVKDDDGAEDPFGDKIVID